MAPERISCRSKRALALSGSAGSGWRGLGGGFRRGRLQARIKPTGVHPSVKGLLGLGIDVSRPDQAAESGLDMGARAPEAVVKIEVAKGSIEVVAPQQGDHATAKPYALRIAGRAGEDTRGLGDFVDLFLGFFGGVGGWLLRLGRLAVATTLGEGRRNCETQARNATKHGRNLTQLERKPHCPRRMFALGLSARPWVLCLRPDWDANTAVI